jgi:hypothetical protein
LKQPHGYAQLFAAILEQLKVLEVAGQADVPEYGLLELDARLNKVAVQIEGRDLAREVRVGGLQPVDVVLVFLHDFDEPLHISGFLQLTNFAFLHDTELCDVYDFHVEFRGFLDLLLQITWKKKSTIRCGRMRLCSFGSEYFFHLGVVQPRHDVCDGLQWHNFRVRHARRQLVGETKCTLHVKVSCDIVELHLIHQDTLVSNPVHADVLVYLLRSKCFVQDGVSVDAIMLEQTVSIETGRVEQSEDWTAAVTHFKHDGVDNAVVWNNVAQAVLHFCGVQHV